MNHFDVTDLSDVQILGVVLALGLVALAILFGLGTGITYYASCQEAEIYNKLNNTSWTCSDFFWSGSQINNSTSTIHLK